MKQIIIIFLLIISLKADDNLLKIADNALYVAKNGWYAGSESVQKSILQIVGNWDLQKKIKIYDKRLIYYEGHYKIPKLALTRDDYKLLLGYMQYLLEVKHKRDEVMEAYIKMMKGLNLIANDKKLLPLLFRDVVGTYILESLYYNLEHKLFLDKQKNLLKKELPNLIIMKKDEYAQVLKYQIEHFDINRELYINAYNAG